MRVCQREINEVIEIGAVKLDDRLVIHGSYSSLVRPVVYPVLTSFCTELTTIQQVDVDSARTFSDVWAEFLDWAGDEQVVGTWGAGDVPLLQRQARNAGLLFPFPSTLNIKRTMGERGLARAVQRWGVQYRGQRHRALVDAQATAEVYVKFLARLSGSRPFG